MANALRPWLKEELLKALNDAKELPIHMGKLGILQIQKFTHYEADPSAGKTISAQLSDKDTYIHCYFTFKCQKEFEQIRESRLTQHKGALVRLLSYKLNVTHHKQTRVLYLEIDELAYKSSQGEAIFGDPKAAHNYPEIKNVLRTDRIERLMGPDPLENVKEREVAPPPPQKEKSPESSLPPTSQMYQTQVPVESQFTMQAPPEDESEDAQIGELAEDQEPQSDSASEEEEEEEEYLHPAWGGLRWENLKWEDIRIPPDQQALLDREEAWYWPGCDDLVEEVLEDEEQVYLEHNANLTMPEIVHNDPPACQRPQGAKKQVASSNAPPATSSQDAPAVDEVAIAESHNTTQFMTQAPMDLSQDSEHEPTSSADDLRTQRHSTLSEADEPMATQEEPFGEENWPASSPVPEAQPEVEADENNLSAEEVVVKVETTIVEVIKEEVLSQQCANDDTERVDHPVPEPILEELDLTIEELHEMEEEERLLSQPTPSRSSQPEPPEIGDESEEFIEQSAENGLGDVERIFQSSVEEIVSSSGTQQPSAPPPTLVTEPAKEDVEVRVEMREEVQVERTIEIPDTVLQESVSQPQEAANALLQEREEEAPPAPTQGSETQDITREILAEDVTEAISDVIERADDVEMVDAQVVEKPVEKVVVPEGSEDVVREQNGQATPDKPIETVDESIGEAAAAAAAATVQSAPTDASPAPAVQSLAKEPSVRRQSSLSSLFREAIMGNTPRSSKAKATPKPSSLAKLRSPKIQGANQTAKRKRSSEGTTASPAASRSHEVAAKRPKTKEKYARVIPDFSGLEASEEDVATIIKNDRARFLAERRARKALAAIEPELEEEDEEIVDTEMGRFAKLWLKVNGITKSTKRKADPLDWRRKLE
ncbi:hypothetical protein YB2330_004232 [Saitoella coloradoensis]